MLYVYKESLIEFNLSQMSSWYKQKPTLNNDWQ